MKKKIFLLIVPILLGISQLNTNALEEKICTKEYAPVCAKVQVQCVTTPCNPIIETFWNRCEMNNNPNATFLYAWVCSETNEEEQNNDDFMCPMIYAPVCWIDGETYSNSCMAQNVGVKYEWECIWNANEKRVYSAWEWAVYKNLTGRDDYVKAYVIEKVIDRVDSRKDNMNLSMFERWVYNFISYLATNTIKNDIYEEYIKDNIFQISPIEPILWWSWYVTKIDWKDKNTAIIYYEDGHIAENIKVEIMPENWEIEVKVLDDELSIDHYYNGDNFDITLKIPTNWEGKYDYDFITPNTLQFVYEANYNEWNNMLFNLNIHTKDEWNQLVDEWLLNMTEVMKMWDYVISYSNPLDMPYQNDYNIRNYTSMYEGVKEVIDRVEIDIN